MRNVQKTKAYQTALADITAVIESSYDDSAGEGGAISLEAIEKFIEENSIDLSDKSGTYRGYWINHTRQDGLPDCFDVYPDKAAVGKINHYHCASSLEYAQKEIDNWKDAR